MTELAKLIPQREYIMFGGKGGLGKTTFSAAMGYWIAQQVMKVLVSSVDPQSSFGGAAYAHPLLTVTAKK